MIGVQVLSELCREWEGSLSYTNPCLKQTYKQLTGNNKTWHVSPSVAVFMLTALWGGGCKNASTAIRWLELKSAFQDITKQKDQNEISVQSLDNRKASNSTRRKLLQLQYKRHCQQPSLRLLQNSATPNKRTRWAFKSLLFVRAWNWKQPLVSNREQE